MIRMPWTDGSAPNVMIEVADACNVICRVCYKRPGDGVRSLAAISRDLEDAMRLRPLHTVTLSGGEPTLHPELCEIVKMVKSRGLHVFLCTNGLLVDGDMLRKLRKAGLDSILFHVDTGQQRPDLPDAPHVSDVCKRLDTLASAAVTQGIDVSFSAILYKDKQDLLHAYSDYFFQNPDLTFMFLSRPVDLRQLRESAPLSESTSRTQEMINYYRERYGIEPFGFIPANRDSASVWTSFFVPVIYNGKREHLFRFRSNVVDLCAMKLFRLLTGRHIHKTVQNPRLTTLRVIMNALSTLRVSECARCWAAKPYKSYSIKPF